ncbi:MAG: RagB/SusD family nutrient uptake outer membrane protein [Lewinellaceae bacterium]|nr:RagB/SusD family nutrient uptake outer membrane protein [Lewinellaceae bacterium]
MKRNYILLAVLTLFFVACNEDFLNEPPLDRITENDVWSDKALMDTYLFKIYDNMPWDYLKDFGGGAGWGAFRDALSDLARSTYSWTPATNTLRPGNWGTANNTWPLDWWGYYNIWKINYALENIEALGEDVLSQEERDNRLGELYFMRAYSYFAMAKRYGGVPIILEAQNPATTPEDEYFPTRNTEQQVYDQVLEDAQRAFELLPDRWNGQKGRAGKWAAKALESRAALYAGSIAKYGTVQLDGLVGIPSAAATAYYELSLAASNEIINKGGFTLFNKYPNPADNYYHLFVDETEDETIFMKIWLPFEKGHSYDLRTTPYSYRVDWGSSMSPSKQLMDSYEMLSTGLLPSESGSGYDPNKPFENRDPRLKGTLLTDNDLFQGSRIETWYATERDGQIDTDRGTGVGKDGMGIHPDATKTGAYVRKYLNDGPTPLLIQEFYSGQDCILFRLGEIYLNAAEAAIELDMESAARDFIEPIRTRAGLTQNLRLDSYSGIALRDRIRNERKIELAFEDQRYWDVRRWRIAEEVLSVQIEGIRSLRHIDGLGQETFTYEAIQAEPEKMKFHPYQYYLPIGQDRVNNNPKLLENPGY